MNRALTTLLCYILNIYFLFFLYSSLIQYHKNSFIGRSFRPTFVICPRVLLSTPGSCYLPQDPCYLPQGPSYLSQGPCYLPQGPLLSTAALLHIPVSEHCFLLVSLILLLYACPPVNPFLAPPCN